MNIFTMVEENLKEAFPHSLSVTSADSTTSPNFCDNSFRGVAIEATSVESSVESIQSSHVLILENESREGREKQKTIVKKKKQPEGRKRRLLRSLAWREKRVHIP
ncbi:MAG: hypothetical protein ACK53Y_00155, partial [bacterium]